MSYDFGLETMDGAAAGIMGVFLIVMLFIYVLMIGVGITAYVFQAIGMYRIAERRGIHHPWLAWIPVGSTWLLGSISDHYQYVVKQKVTNRRKILVILEAVMYVALVMAIGLMVAMMFSLETETAGGLGAALGMLAVALILEAVSIATLVFLYMACFDLFRSCRPQNDVLFLILSVFIPITISFFIFACSKYDLGMPPRKEPQTPAQIPCVPAEDVVAEPESGEN